MYYNVKKKLTNLIVSWISSVSCIREDKNSYRVYSRCSECYSLNNKCIYGICKRLQNNSYTIYDS